MSSGYINFDKDLVDDPRVDDLADVYTGALKRILTDLGINVATVDPDAFRNALLCISRNAALGALSRLWCYADTYIRENNSLLLKIDKLSEKCLTPVAVLQQMPPEWLQTTTNGQVVLPEYVEKNRLVAREVRRANGRVRSKRFRDRHKADGVVVSSNVPDAHVGVRPTNGVTQKRNASRAPPRARVPSQPNPVTKNTEDSIFLSAQKMLTSGTASTAELEAHSAMERIRATYPRFTGRQDWITAEQHARNFVENNITSWEVLLDGVGRYAKYCAQGGVDGPRYVLTPGKFFGAADKPWSQSWELPQTKAQTKQAKNIKAGLDWLAEQEAKDYAPK